jgi:1,4-alpha-glucan branching enzyme
MAKKEDAGKVAGKNAKTSKPGKAVKNKAAGTQAPARTQKKLAAQKEPAQAPARAGTTFRLEAPQAAQVFIVGCFNGWDPMANPLKRDEEGIWSCTLSIEPGEHEYRFVVDGVWWDDPANTLRRWNEFGTENCVLVVHG